LAGCAGDSTDLPITTRKAPNQAQHFVFMLFLLCFSIFCRNVNKAQETAGHTEYNQPQGIKFGLSESAAVTTVAAVGKCENFSYKGYIMWGKT